LPRDVKQMAENLSCPLCNAARGEQSVLVAENAIVNSCRACGGIWIAANVFEQLVKQAGEGNADATAALAKAAAGAKQGRPKSAKPIADTGDTNQAVPAYLPCPVCTELMGRQNFAHRSGVKVHACRQHGVWFDDQRQLESLINWVESGALAAARKDLKDQESRAERTRQRLIREGLDDSSALGRDWSSG
jgi:Zn-finger nucleic acid-binding protein